MKKKYTGKKIAGVICCVLILCAFMMFLPLDGERSTKYTMQQYKESFLLRHNTEHSKVTKYWCPYCHPLTWLLNTRFHSVSSSENHFEGVE